ncbi:MAG: RNA-binding protein [Candidatus Methanomethylophilaceae archaeon]|nr:RNA-binding protein [Candidatus Methanomethylophilaceae archaeon]MDI3541779.1 RNA-binding protein [Candidatus Methanomethylophilaceae archaeon]HIJ00728.1 YhbY family RNA-binding protein [Candidatus Methanomethylophilaceae archaeon]
MTEKEAIKELRRRGLEIKPTIHIGKDGITEGLVQELIKQVKNNKLVKVRILDSAQFNAKDIGKDLAERTGVILVDSRGSVLLYSDMRTYQQLIDKKA